MCRPLRLQWKVDLCQPISSFYGWIAFLSKRRSTSTNRTAQQQINGVEIIDALVLAGNNVKNVGFIVDQVWPLGNLFVSSQDQKTLRPEESITLGYLNITFCKAMHTDHIPSFYRGSVNEIPKFPTRLFCGFFLFN